MRIPLANLEEKLAASTPQTVWPAPAARAAILNALSEGDYAVGLFDAGDRLVYSNKAFREGWAIEGDSEVTFDSMIRKCHASNQGAVVKTSDIEAWLDAARTNRRHGPANRSFEVDLWDGRWLWLTERRLDNGWILFIGQDITALKNSERTLRQARDVALKASVTDPLTQLPNRRAAMEFLDQAIGHGEPFHVALIDIDNFKKINDTYGHTIGDDVLILLSTHLLTLHDRGYFVARLAGDEFSVISPPLVSRGEFQASLTNLLAEQRRAVEVCGFMLEVCISIGASSFPAHGLDTRALLHAADAALYEAKLAGRCTIRFFDRSSTNLSRCL